MVTAEPALLDRPRAVATERLRISVRGLVQGVGFRPFVHRRAVAHGLAGWVLNGSKGVVIEIEGPSQRVAGFVDGLRSAAPRHAEIESVEVCEAQPTGTEGFSIRPSVGEGEASARVPVDLATCPDCLAEILDPNDRRHLYPFTTCTHCGPRYSIIDSMPYDRPGTSMRQFPMCQACEAEYEDPDSRRFHAQSNACPVCGPRLALWDSEGGQLDDGHPALLRAAKAIRDGAIVALKGVGGFHLIADAYNQDVVRRLRERKHRPDKPFALMFPSREAVDAHCRVDWRERELLTSPRAPIILVARRPGSDLADAIAPGNPRLGVMLPYTPLHHLLMRELGFPVVATSGNLSDEPIVTDEHEAEERLRGIADLFLVHDRPIVRPLDDSVIRVVLGREQVLRAARGYAPYVVDLPRRSSRDVLALGAELKTTAAITLGDRIVVSPHVGDVSSPEGTAALERTAGALATLHGVAPQLVSCDLHPDYRTTRVAEGSGLERIAVQHHLAHVAACMAEHGLDGPVLGVAWDGTGYGPDGTVWGGEFLLVDRARWHRVGHLRCFRLPGGEAAVQEPRRSALGLLYEAFGSEALDWSDLAPVASFAPAERGVLATALARGINAPLTSSVGRLFDGVAALLGPCQWASYEGQAAGELEWAAEASRPDRAFSFELDHRDGNIIVDWAPCLSQIMAAVRAGADSGEVAGSFHAGMAGMIAAVAERIGEGNVVLTGGCFQNATLLEATVGRLCRAGLRPYWHSRVPTNDGGIAVGQAAWAARVIGSG
jgi:hydrogenase maturation protein HypF